MAVIAHVILRGVPKEDYNKVRAEAAWLEQAPAGGLAHVTWWDGNDCHNIDAWESEDAFNSFVAERLAPAMERAGVSAQPEVVFHPAHEVFTPQVLRLT